MNTDPYTPPSSPAGGNENSSRYSPFFSVLSWLQWIILAMSILIIYTFSYRIDPDRNHWALNLTGIIMLMVLLPLALFFGVFLFRKLSNPWFRLLVYGLGLLGIFTLFSCGFFAVLSGDYSLVAVGLIGLIMHCPLINKRANKSAHTTAGSAPV